MEHRTERLDRIAQRLAHAPRFVWRPGMLARDTTGFWMRGKPQSAAMFPDLTDPPTIGCLAATVIEIYCEAEQLQMTRNSDHTWSAVLDAGSATQQFSADSFAELLALLIEAAL